MTRWVSLVVFAILLLSSGGTAQDKASIKPQLILSEIVQGMPKGEKQEVRVLTASFQPGERTLFHMHRFPVTVYVLEGTFSMEIAGREPIIVKSGQAGIMPPHLKMTGYNRSRNELLWLVAVYVSDPNTPFLDPVHTP